MDTRTYFLVMVVNVFLMGFCDSCPYLDLRCNCYGKTVNCRNLITVPPLESSNSGIDTLEFVDGNLTSIPANSLPPNLYSITLYRVPINYIDPNAFQSSAYTLRELTIYAKEGEDFKMDDLPDAILTIKNLTLLSLSDTKFKGNNLTALQHAGKTLRILYLDEAYSEYKPEFYQYFALLEEARIIHYSKYEFPNDIYKHVAGTLKTLHLEGFYWPSFKNVFSGLQLVRLSLKFNTIANDIDNLTIALLPLSGTLQHLSITFNELVIVPNLSRMSSLSTLDLNNNVISEVTADKLPIQLKNLDLFTNNITSLTDASFPTGSLLEILNMTGNGVNEISPSAFQSVPNMRILEIGDTTQLPVALINLRKVKGITLGVGVVCPHPLDRRLVQWYCSVNQLTIISGLCKDGKQIADYLAFETACTSGANPHVTGMHCLYTLYLIVASVSFSLSV